MIKAFALPEFSAALEVAINLSGGELLDAVLDLPDFMVAEGLADEMEMVRHDDEGCQMVAVAIEMLKGVFDDFTALRVSQLTFAVAFIE
ncbi:hypothetical protein N9A89_01865 [Akkermansiaceae bacterium]|nr:hypothetical protein [Akkermansiaceae bacterium]MDB4532538.1 hypothetical protein [bacterium]MDB4313696.1 hypothetical protein [Akkermansiaceae bacterium]MDB4377843.1 hypothetical protein [Akkermansiaceae bacterium]MDB4578465.1 hypothetical protein [Akkermansiaceae bacterium]